MSSEENFIITFKNSVDKYTVPIEKLYKFPDSYFMRHIHFTNKYECELTVCDYDEFANVYNYIVHDKVSMIDYVTNINLLDYLGVRNNFNDCLIELFDSQCKIVNSFINGSEKYILIDSFDDYVIYKKMFSKIPFIIPFQYVSVIRINFNYYLGDALFYGNGELCDFGNKKESYLKFTLNKEFPKGVIFDWLFDLPKSTPAFFTDAIKSSLPTNFYCAHHMKKEHNNEIEHILSGINKMYYKFVSYHGYGVISKRENQIKINSIKKKFKGKKNMSYEYPKGKLSFNNFDIRDKLNKQIIAEDMKSFYAYKYGSNDYLENIVVGMHIGFFNIESKK